MKKEMSLTLALLLIASPSVQAAVGQIQRIYPDGNGRINFRLKADSCNAEYNYYYFDSTTPQGKNWYALLLASAYSGTAVAVRFWGDDAACNPGIDKQVAYIYVEY